MNKATPITIVLSSLLVLACANPGEVAPATDAVGSCGGATAPLGVTEGMGFAPMVLEQCEGEPYVFYGDDEGYCASRLTVVSIAAGWCAPCIRETAELEDAIVARYGADGVRVVQVLVEDADYRETSPSYCAGWRDRFELRQVPVLRDPAGSVLPYYDGSLPATLIIDDQGVVVHREVGASEGLETLAAALDELTGI
ncbi:MAG: TlpA family protein disulfide reductase [Sandaracinaceae bacterium]